MKKTIYFQTNYNNKLACNSMIHIDLAPQQSIAESKLTSLEFEIRTSDNSHPPVMFKVVDLIRIPLTDIGDLMTWQSHGMNSDEYLSWLLNENQAITIYSTMAVYFYKRVFL